MINRRTFKILVVDDNDDIRFLITEMLTDKGFSVYQAHDSEEATSILETKDIQLIVSDIQMPGQSGLELLKKIRSLDSTLPFFLFSSCAEFYEREALANGATKVVSKVDYSLLVKMVEDISNKSPLDA